MVRTRGGERAKKTGIKYFRWNGVLRTTTPVENECPAVSTAIKLPPHCFLSYRQDPVPGKGL